MSDTPEKLLRKADVVEVLGLSPRTIDQLVKDGQLPAIRLGHRTRRFRAQDIEAYIERHREVVQ